VSSEVLFVFILESVLRNIRVELLGQVEGPALHNEALLTFVIQLDTARTMVHVVRFHSSFTSNTCNLMCT